jgi:hypothetical protein
MDIGIGIHQAKFCTRERIAEMTKEKAIVKAKQLMKISEGLNSVKEELVEIQETIGDMVLRLENEVTDLEIKHKINWRTDK